MENKNSNLVAWLALGLVVVMGFYGLSQLNSIRSSNAGAALTYSAALDHAETHTLLSALITDNGTDGSVTIDFPSVATSTVGWQSATTTTVTGATAGDMVLVGPETPTQWITYTANVLSGNTVELVAHNASTSAVNPASSVFNFRIVPQTLTATQ